MNIQWKSNYFESIDPVEARRILDEELYGMERVKPVSYTHLTDVIRHFTAFIQCR